MAEKFAADPKQIGVLTEAVATGNGFTVTLTVTTLVHPAALMPIKVYMPDATGCTLEIFTQVFVLTKAFGPAHVYVFAPLAQNDKVNPAQMGVLTVMVGEGKGFTVTFMVREGLVPQVPFATTEIIPVVPEVLEIVLRKGTE